MSNDTTVFDDLPKYDPTKFEVPAWATGPSFDYRKNGESSRSARSQNPDLDESGSHLDAHTEDGDGDDSDEEEEEEEEEEEVWEDAQDDLDAGVEDSPDGIVFTVAELRKLVDRAQLLKEEGNIAYTSKPPQTELAIEKYESALKLLPPVPKLEQVITPPAPSVSGGIQEITDEEADAITLAEKKVLTEREEVEGMVRDCGKACHGNLAACWALLKDDKNAVEACTKALELDPGYTKALHRRATANDRIGTWSSLTAAKEDYEKLLTLISTSSPQYSSTRTSLSGLPRRIAAQQEKEKDEMLNQLKTLGNGLLGKFGLSTDMFKFEQQPGGGYGVKFER